ncbi:MAG TPA: antitoxin family protein [Aggregatilineaceae bacterium]|jgi:predicted DNA-binding antitoxin AbrB/MazE fold protein|nr:antitoxin family protein [Aggregatilineaceae bacterium]
MGISVRAVYQDGQLRLLDAVDLADGQIVDVTIGTESEPPALTADLVEARLRAAGLLMDMDEAEDAAELSPEERERIGSLFVGERRTEDLIDEDRGLY